MVRWTARGREAGDSLARYVTGGWVGGGGGEHFVFDSIGNCNAYLSGHLQTGWCACLYVCVCVCACLCMHACMCVCVCVCVCVRVCVNG